MNNDLISRSELKKAIESIKQNVEEWVNHTDCDITIALAKIKIYELFIDLIDNAPTVELTEEQAIDKLHETGWLIRHDKEMTERPQGEWKRHDEWRSGEYIGGFYHVNCPCEDGYYSKWETNFCPNCGLPMKKGGTA